MLATRITPQFSFLLRRNAYYHAKFTPWLKLETFSVIHVKAGFYVEGSE